MMAEMFEIDVLTYLAAGVALVGIMAYAVLGGADFGGGVWDLLAMGPRKRLQRQAIARAMGPVWEANHVWLIFVIVVLFTCFPYAYSPLCIALFIPFHLALLGIMLRGASFVFRGYGGRPRGPATSLKVPAEEHAGGWSVVFGVASIISPLLLGASFGAVTAGGVVVTADRQVVVEGLSPWLRPYSIGCGLLALSTCAYLAAVYLTVETDKSLREDFRRRAIVAGTGTAALAGVVLVLAAWQAPWFFEQLISLRALPVLAAGVFFFAASAWAVFTRRYSLSRVFAAGEIVLLLLGWGLAQQPFLVYPSLTLVDAAAPAATIRFMLWSLPVGALVLAPSLWYLFKVFKSQAGGFTAGQGAELRGER
jgi:cytochrome bd ubiquinol oxidase subunit II